MGGRGRSWGKQVDDGWKTEILFAIGELDRGESEKHSTRGYREVYC